MSCAGTPREKRSKDIMCTSYLKQEDLTVYAVHSYHLKLFKCATYSPLLSSIKLKQI